MEIELPEQPQGTALPANIPQQGVAVGERYGVTGRTNPELVQSMVGCFANDPAFDRVVKFMEDERAREREEAEREADREDADIAAV